ncbi:Integral membrane protein [Neofusicoccum parvum]|uniref:Integral membrane protein n=1 Tax=Neofusicoccum parvum TaxID=310453 RepID=A0ACB5SJE7_9PEZI|nr:Integral membrane protein [Neofusicoccum parvum]
MASDGVTGPANVGLPILMTMSGFLAISFYNVIELLVIIFTTFKQRSGLYFWSFIVATVGIAPHALGFVLKFFAVVPASLWWLPVALVAVGFPAMVTGQSVVLYSRLHLVVRDPRRLRWVLWMIIVDGVVMSVPLVVMAFGANSPNPAAFLGVFTVWDKIQIAVFAVQEILISVMYIYETTRLLHPSPTSNKALRKILIHLVAVNAVVLAFDITLLGVQYSNQYEIQTTYKGAVYSIKLKLEFSVLNNLISVIKNRELSFGGRGSSTTHSHRLDNFTLNSKKSKGSADYGFSRIEDSYPPPPKGLPSNDMLVERIEECVGAEDRDDIIAEDRRRSTAPGQQEIGVALQPKKPRSGSASQASDVELIRLPEASRGR